MSAVCAQVCVCECLLTDKARIHRSVIVIGECIEDVVVFELKRLMNNPLHHLKYFLITSLISRGTWGGRETAAGMLLLRMLETTR